MLPSTAEGMLLRIVAGLNEGAVDWEKNHSLLGTNALCIFMGAVDFGDGLCLEEAADNALDRRRSVPVVGL